MHVILTDANRFVLQAVIDYIRIRSHSTCYAVSVPAPIVQQVLSSMKIIMGLDNTNSGKLIVCDATASVVLDV